MLGALLPDPQLHRASASASLSCSFSARIRRSVEVPPLLGPGTPLSNPALPASTNRSRHRATVYSEVPCQRAASAMDISLPSTCQHHPEPLVHGHLPRRLRRSAHRAVLSDTPRWSLPESLTH